MKKTYAPPTIEDLGGVVEQTKGVAGDWWETWGNSWGPIPPPDDEGGSGGSGSSKPKN
jgi:hypothetical protein